ncbi:MAG TPA: sensor histidine kinase [Spirochaetia bacterium]|nr:sensor histidine kinase [Spirochaetia bacterium]
MRTPLWTVTRVTNLVTTLAGHGVAAAMFLFSFTNPALRGVWLPQFFILLSLATALLLIVPDCRTNSRRAVVLLGAMLVEVVLGIPQGPDLALEAVLGTVFVFVVMTEVEGTAAFLLCLVYSVAVSSSHWPILAWGVRIAGAPPLHAALLGIYLLFLAWLARLVGSRGQQIRRQHEELIRIDRTVRALSEANLDFQELATRVQRETEEQERRRITREIHDIVGYTLTNIQMMMEAATDLAHRDTAGLEELLLKSRDQAQKGLLETRRAMRNFRAVSEAKKSGLSRVAEVVRIFERATKVSVRLRLGNAPDSFGTVIDDVVYRMVQESLTNALRHGNASEITVNFWVGDGALRLSVTDNGIGSKEIVPGIGLSGMAERLAHVGGSLKAENSPFGFVISGEIPLHRAEGA